MPLSAGFSLGHYTIVAPLGKGGMGEVYRAKDTHLDREVAIKVLPEQLTGEVTALQRFEREAKALAVLANPNIVSIFDFGSENGVFYAVMELLEGETLRQCLRRKSVSQDHLSSIAAAVLNGLAAAHSKGVIHRDLKPENIFLASDGRVKILDFGLARRSAPTEQNVVTELATVSRLTADGVTVGTVPYMSPEQIRGGNLDARSDIFSFGCVLYEMLTGNRAFDRDSTADTAAAILKDEPSLQMIPTELQRIVRHCLEKNPDDRYHSVRDLAYDLKSLSSGVPHSIPQERIPRPRRLPWTPFAVVALILIIAGAVFLTRSKFSPVVAHEKSVAVLPFRNMNSNQQDEYFSDGITEDIITQLSRVGELRVISRTSIMQYKNTRKKLSDIGKELQVANILEGSVRREGNRLRIVGQLIDAQTDEHIWAETYDRELRDVFEIQSDVAQRIAVALKAKLSSAEEKRIEKKQTNSVTAYDYYLRGREFYLRFHKQDNERAIELFRKALEIDQNYALAYAGLGDAYMRRKAFGMPLSSVDLAEQACNKAISIDPSLAEAYNALQKVYGSRGAQDKAFETIKRAVELNPNLVGAVMNLSATYMGQGKPKEAFPLSRRVVSLDPANAFAYLNLGEVYLLLDDPETAEELFEKSIQLAPDFTFPHGALSEVYLAQGNYEKARKEAEFYLKLDPEVPFGYLYAGQVEVFAGNYEKAILYLQKMPHGITLESYQNTPFAFAFWKLGKQKEAEAIFQENQKIDLDLIRKNKKTSYSFYFDLASIYAIHGNRNEAFRWLQQAIHAGQIYYRHMMRNPMLENLHDDPRFQQMMNAIKSRMEKDRRSLNL